MTHTQQDSNYQIRETLHTLLRYYFSERNSEKVIAMAADDIYSLGLIIQEVSLNKTELKALFDKEIALMPFPIRYTIEKYEEKKICDLVYQCFCSIEAWADSEEQEMQPYRTHLTAGFRREGELRRVYELHMTKFQVKQESDESFPLLYSAEKQGSINQYSQRELLSLMSEFIPGGIMGTYYTEPGFPLYIINNKMLELLGYTYDELMEETGGLMEDFVHPNDKSMLRDVVMASFEVDKEYKLEYRLRKKDGSYIWVYDMGRKILTGDNRKAIVSIVADISESVEMTQRFREAATKDPLTGLYNRRVLIEYLNGFFPNTLEYSFLMIDIDNFKSINDTYGHKSGDLVLLGLADIFCNNFRSNDLIVRIGGDEFIIFMPGNVTETVLLDKLRKINREYGALLQEVCPRCSSSLSIGGVYGTKCSDFDELYKTVDGILYEVKTKNKGCSKMLNFDVL